MVLNDPMDGAWRTETAADPAIYLGGGQTKFSDQKLRAEPESRARSARVEGAKRLRIEGEARTEGEAREKTGEGSGEGAR